MWKAKSTDYAKKEISRPRTLFKYSREQRLKCLYKNCVIRICIRDGLGGGLEGPCDFSRG